ncbi:carbohydrate binding domain-containing protein, partial [Patescibacteria group bacterium]|nr:carbohydrate binding domain-containing protein [Patescibacteria group bacterium]
MKRKVKIIIFLLVILVLIIAAYFILNKYIFADIERGDNTTGEAENYLTGLKNKITFDYWDNIVKKGDSSGFEKNILANISNDNSPDDYEAFTRMRARIFNYISGLKGYNIQAPEPAKNTSKITAELAPQKDETGVNLLVNGGFEENVKGIPIGWQDQWKAGGDKTLDGKTKRSGQKSWKFQQEGEAYFQGALSDFIPIREDKTYKFSAWIKTKEKTRLYVQWFEFEDEQSNSLDQPYTSYIGSGMNYIFDSGQNQWQKVNTAIKARKASTKYIRIKIASFKGTVWWDDLSLVNVGSEYLNSFGCVNDNLARCIDLGPNNENEGGEIVEINEKMSPKTAEGSINYRSIIPQGSIEINFPEFNTDQDGLPKTPMLLEIRYKDTLDYPEKVKTAYSERAVVYSKIGYQAKDNFLYGYASFRPAYLECQKTKPTDNEPDKCFPSDRINYAIFRLGDINDKKWKYAQFPFPRTSLPLTRALNGKFTFSIVMPKSEEYKSSSLPIDYISLRAISEADFSRFDEKQRELTGYYQINFKDEPLGSVDYRNKDLVLFSRDLMRPVYKSTVPRPEEINKEVFAFSTLGEIEPANFAIYSGEGIDGLTFVVDDLQKGKE